MTAREQIKATIAEGLASDEPLEKLVERVRVIVGDDVLALLHDLMAAERAEAGR